MVWTLLPDSDSWNDDQWCNDSYICDEINKKYNTHFNNLYEDFIPVTYLIKYSLGIDIPVSSILPAKTITPGIVKAIFKEKTNSFVYKFFCQIDKELSDDVTLFLLAGSWMLEIMKSWTNDENHPYRNAVKKTVFDMIMQTSI